MGTVLRMKYIVHTDGAALTNPGLGGFAALVQCGDSEPLALTGRDEFTTNNRMEMMAVIVALEQIPAGSEVQIWSDSQYVIQPIMLKWVEKWAKKNWLIGSKPRGGPKKERPNADLWKRMLKAIARHEKVNLQWLRGHSGHALNEQCDALADEAARKGKACLQ
jgi:ribonuclease HI